MICPIKQPEEKKTDILMGFMSFWCVIIFLSHIFSLNINLRGSMSVQRLALLPHSEKVLGLNPLAGL